MYLILPTPDARIRNMVAAANVRNDMVSTRSLWRYTILTDGTTALHVGDGEGLTTNELAQCVNELPYTKLYFDTPEERDAFNAGL